MSAVEAHGGREAQFTCDKRAPQNDAQRRQRAMHPFFGGFPGGDLSASPAATGMQPSRIGLK
jgi:hypothetical protein